MPVRKIKKSYRNVIGISSATMAIAQAQFEPNARTGLSASAGVFSRGRAARSVPLDRNVRVGPKFLTLLGLNPGGNTNLS